MQRIVAMSAFATLLALPLAGQAELEPAQVKVESVESLVFHPERQVAASVVALNESKLAAQVAAPIRRIHVRVGEEVAAGAKLISLDGRDFKLALAQAEAAVEANQARIRLARFQLEQVKALSGEALASEEALRQRQAELAAYEADDKRLRAAVDLARRNLEKCTVRAPYHAVVKARLAAEGEWAAPGTPLLELVESERLEVQAQLQPQDVAALEQGRELAFVSQGRRYPLELLRISPAYDSRQRSREARFAFTAARDLPGAAGELVWRDGRGFLPAKLLSRRGGQMGVFTLRGSTARFVSIPSASEGRPALNPLAVGSRVITEGRFSLTDGSRVAAN